MKTETFETILEMVRENPGIGRSKVLEILREHEIDVTVNEVKKAVAEAKKQLRAEGMATGEETTEESTGEASSESQNDAGVEGATEKPASEKKPAKRKKQVPESIATQVGEQNFEIMRANGSKAIAVYLIASDGKKDRVAARPVLLKIAEAHNIPMMGTDNTRSLGSRVLRKLAEKVA